MKTILFAVATFLISINSHGTDSKKCMTEAISRSMNLKLQNLALNISIDEEVTFSCTNLTRQDIRELIYIRADQIKIISAASDKLHSGRSISSLEVSRLGADLGIKTMSSNEMCPMIEADYQLQISRSLANTFPKELRNCPSNYKQIRSRYLKIISADYVAQTGIQDACQKLVSKLQDLKQDYTMSCGQSHERRRHKFGNFNKVSRR